MLLFSLKGLTLAKEEVYLNQKLSKGWLLKKKWYNFFYFFERNQNHKQENIAIDLAVKPFEELPEEPSLFQQEKGKKHYRISYFLKKKSVTRALVDKELEIDYYQELLNNYFSFFNILIVSFVSIFCLFYGIATLKGQPPINSLWLILPPLVYLFFFIKIYFPLNQAINDLKLQVEHFKSHYLPCYIAISGTKTNPIDESFGYLGEWLLKTRRKNTWYFTLQTAANEDDIKEDLEEAFKGSDVRVSITSSSGLWPIG